MSSEVAVTDDYDERIDRIIWKGLGVKTARQIAEEAGITPEAVLKRKRELLESIDVLSLQEKRAKLLVDLQRMSETAREDYERADYEFKAGLMNSAIAALKIVMAELKALEKADQTKVDALNSMRVRELLGLMDEVITLGVRDISERHDLDEASLFEVFQIRLVEAAQKRDETL